MSLKKDSQKSKTILQGIDVFLGLLALTVLGYCGFLLYSLNALPQAEAMDAEILATQRQVALLEARVEEQTRFVTDAETAARIALETAQGLPAHQLIPQLLTGIAHLHTDGEEGHPDIQLVDQIQKFGGGVGGAVIKGQVADPVIGFSRQDHILQGPAGLAVLGADPGNILPQLLGTAQQGFQLLNLRLQTRMLRGKGIVIRLNLGQCLLSGVQCGLTVGFGLFNSPGLLRQPGLQLCDLGLPVQNVLLQELCLGQRIDGIEQIAAVAQRHQGQEGKEYINSLQYSFRLL